MNSGIIKETFVRSDKMRRVTFVARVALRFLCRRVCVEGEIKDV